MQLFILTHLSLKHSSDNNECLASFMWSPLTPITGRTLTPCKANIVSSALMIWGEVNSFSMWYSGLLLNTAKHNLLLESDAVLAQTYHRVLVVPNTFHCNCSQTECTFLSETICKYQMLWNRWSGGAERFTLPYKASKASRLQGPLLHWRIWKCSFIVRTSSIWFLKHPIFIFNEIYLWC